VGGRVASWAGPDVSGRYKGGVLALEARRSLVTNRCFLRCLYYVKD
jgi:hypothetical protein